jgi:hypothetical protein
MHREAQRKAAEINDAVRLKTLIAIVDAEAKKDKTQKTTQKHGFTMGI